LENREVIMRKPEVFKMACLRDIRRLFGKTSVNPFYAGLGNRITDALSYRSVDVPSSRIFTIDSAGEVKMELLELAGYKSSYVIKLHIFLLFLIVYSFAFAPVRYIHMTDLVDQMFPPIHRHMDAHFTDFNFWRPPMDEDDLPELTPPSPALSARSDTSNRSTLARLRNMSLMGSSRMTQKQFSLPLPTTESSIKGRSKEDSEWRRGPGTRDSHLRQISSFERLSNTLSNFVPSTSSHVASPISSPSVLDSGDEDEDIDLERQTRGRTRARRTSMPGSLPGNLDDERDERERGEGEGEGEGEEGEEEDDYGYDAEHEEQTFDDDIFATGEMENVPFL
jgi:phosphatidate phosphatase LPIN